MKKATYNFFQNSQEKTQDRAIFSKIMPLKSDTQPTKKALFVLKVFKFLY